MIRVQTGEEWARRTREVQEALATIQRCIRSAPEIPVIPGARYRMLIAGNVIESGELRLENVGDFAEGAGTKLIVGRVRGRLRAPTMAEGMPTARGSILLEIEEPPEARGKAAVFADMDVLEYEGLGA